MIGEGQAASFDFVAIERESTFYQVYPSVEGRGG